MEQWKTVIWSDESCFALFPISIRVYLWRKPSQAYNTDCLLLRVKHGGGSVMIRAAISWFTVGPMITLQGHIKAKDYVNILADQIHPMDWFSEHEEELSHIPWPSQSPDLRIIEPLWSTSERNVCGRCPPPSSLSEVATVLQEEWYKIPLASIHKLYLSIPKKLQAVLNANGFPTSY
ncbi:Transposable element Tc1 transposase [Araneus ventricosus]|uniref:Transposable element Tc1 transposase n=1 Tax=Araneus ventricosus TaxID=182803 RepID=A0A4Y2MAM2_ARAVE|nr:Transposable element Tc1 transposase [Araneus ventricosus]